jgi:hypothetical protein
MDATKLLTAVGAHHRLPGCATLSHNSAAEVAQRVTSHV